MIRWNPHYHALVLDGGFDAFDFLAELTKHVPPKGVQLIRCYGLYASLTRAAGPIPHHLCQFKQVALRDNFYYYF